MPEKTVVTKAGRKLRTDEERRNIIAEYDELCSTGMNKMAAAKQAGAHYASVREWKNKFKDPDFRRPSNCAPRKKKAKSRNGSKKLPPLVVEELASPPPEGAMFLMSPNGMRLYNPDVNTVRRLFGLS